MKDDKDLFIDVFDNDSDSENDNDSGIKYNSFGELEEDEFIQLEDVSVSPEKQEKKLKEKVKNKQSSEENDISEEKTVKTRKTKKKNKVWNVAGKILITLLTTVIILVVFLYVVMWILVKGPSETAKNQFVCAVNESSAMGFLANLYLSKSEIKQITSSNLLQELDDGEVSDTGLVVIPSGGNEDVPDIQLLDIKGKTYRGKMIIVKDPSRVSVGTIETFYEGPGKVVSDICERYGAIAGINGGEFVDMGSYSYTAMPIGCVISQGEHIFGDLYSTYNITGITKENKLVVGKMTVKEALEMGVRDAVHTVHTTGPVLIFNGEPMTVPDTTVYGGGTNPRTALGQRADGAILLLVVDGRQGNSIGATFEDLIDIMAKYGAVNASAMDGGTSTQMVYEGEVVNSPYSPAGPRKCPTAWIVK